MRYSLAHKEATRRRILEMAARVFRERGVAEAGVDEVMRRSGLTHGGFYAHFRNKSELVVEASRAAFDAAVPNLDRIAALRTAAARARLLIDSYLAPRHRDNRGSGCLVVSVGADMVRLPAAARGSFGRGFGCHLDRLAAALRLSSDPVRNRERVICLMSSLVGALLMARAIDDLEQSAAILSSVRRQLRAEFCRPRVRIPACEPGHDFMRTF